jgi:glycosyltransferase involved in cell wall biosynthesis
MRLLYVCSDFGIPPAGTKGASIHLRAITRALSEAGHEIRLLSPRGGPGAGHPAQPLLAEGRFDAEGQAHALGKWLKERDLPTGAAKELRPLLYNLEVLQPARDAAKGWMPDAILERLSLFGHVGADMASALGVPLALEVNALLADEARRFRGLELVSLARAVERSVFERADMLLPVSKQLADQLIAGGVPSGKVRVVPNGADLTRFASLPSRERCRNELGLSGGFLVGFVGSLKIWHGADVLISAFAKLVAEHSRARLMIIGSGPQESDLWQAARAQGVDQFVTFTGAVPHERIPRLLRALDVAVAPYTPMDGFYFSPIKLFEYMAAGTSLIASRIGQIEEIIQDGVSGLLTKPGDVDDLCRALLRLYDSEKLRERLAMHAGEIVRTKYTWSHAAASTAEAIAGALARRDIGSSAVGSVRNKSSVIARAS